MEKILLPGTALQVSALGLGGSNLGSALPEAAAMELMDAYLAAGGNLIDTAHVYGAVNPEDTSASEAVIGKWMKERNNREDLVLCTKGGHPRIDPASFSFGPSRLQPEDLEFDLGRSLMTLGTSYIDLYFLHRDDPAVPVSRIIDWCEEKCREGKLRYYGCSNWSAARIEEANAYAREKGCAGFVCDQLAAGLGVNNGAAMTGTGMEILGGGLQSFHEKTGMAVMSSQSLCEGYFHKRLKGTELPPFLGFLYGNSENDAIFAYLQELTGQGLTVNSILYHFIRSWNFPAVALMGFSSVKQLQEMITDIEVPVPEEALQKLHELRGSGTAI